jgi:hypothetical protein
MPMVRDVGRALSRQAYRMFPAVDVDARPALKKSTQSKNLYGKCYNLPDFFGASQLLQAFTMLHVSDKFR